MSGRGAYYKEKYGGGRGRGGGGGGGRGYGGGGGGRGGGGTFHDRGGGDRQSVADSSGNGVPSSPPGGNSKAHLITTLERIDNKSYPCYKDLLGSWNFEDKLVSFVLHVDHVQG